MLAQTKDNAIQEVTRLKERVTRSVKARPRRQSGAAPASQRPRKANLTGPIVSAITVLLMAFPRLLDVDVSNPPIILSAVVVFAAFTGGFRAGLLSAFVTWMYLVYFFASPGAFLEFTPDHMEELLIWTVILPLLVMMVGWLYRRAIQEAPAYLRASEERFRLLAESLKDEAIVMLDRHGAISSWNFGASRMYGFREEEILGQNFSSLYHPEEAEQGTPTENLEIASAKGSREAEEDLVRKDGSEFRAAVVITPLHDEEGKIRGYSMAARDLTERYEAEAALLNRAHQQVAVAALGQAALVGIDLPTLMDHAATYIGQTFQAEFSEVFELQPDGKSLILRAGSGWKEGYVGQTVVDASPDSLIGFTLHSAEPVIIKDLRVLGRFLVPGFLRDHGVLSGITMAIPGRDRAFGVLGVHTRKLTGFKEEDFHFLQALANVLASAHARKQTEAENEKLAAFAQFNPNPVMEFSSDGTLTYFNAAARKIAKSLGKDYPQELLPAETPSIIQECQRTGNNLLGLERSLEGRTIEWSFFPIPVINRVHVYAVDITQRLVLEAQLRQSQKIEAIGQLAAGVAHDFNNILTIMQGHIGRLLNKDPRPEQIDPLEQVFTATDRAAGLTRQLLTFSRRQEIQPRPLDLHEIVSNMTRMLERLIGADIALQVEKGTSLPAISADPGMMEQVVMNLVVNARDAMPRGGKVIISTGSLEIDGAFVQRHPDAQLGPAVRLQVTDTGTGMDEATKCRIFEPFFTTKEVGKGTGLGLATVYGIVKQHQGWIEVDSEVGQGTTFSMIFPAIADAVESVIPEADSGRDVKGGSETILVVEDEPLLRELACAILQDCGYKVLTAESGAEAIKVWRPNSEKIDLLLTDMVMPGGMTGRELTETLQAEKPELRVVYTSGYSTETVGGDFHVTEGLNFLQKPYHPPTLAKTVRACLDAGAGEAELALEQPAGSVA